MHVPISILVGDSSEYSTTLFVAEGKQTLKWLAQSSVKRFSVTGTSSSGQVRRRLDSIPKDLTVTLVRSKMFPELEFSPSMHIYGALQKIQEHAGLKRQDPSHAAELGFEILTTSVPMLRQIRLDPMAPALPQGGACGKGLWRALAFSNSRPSRVQAVRMLSEAQDQALRRVKEKEEAEASSLGIAIKKLQALLGSEMDDPKRMQALMQSDFALIRWNQFCSTPEQKSWAVEVLERYYIPLCDLFRHFAGAFSRGEMFSLELIEARHLLSTCGFDVSANRILINNLFMRAHMQKRDYADGGHDDKQHGLSRAGFFEFLFYFAHHLYGNEMDMRSGENLGYGRGLYKLMETRLHPVILRLNAGPVRSILRDPDMQKWLLPNISALHAAYSHYANMPDSTGLLDLQGFCTLLTDSRLLDDPQAITDPTLAASMQANLGGSKPSLTRQEVTESFSGAQRDDDGSGLAAEVSQSQLSLGEFIEAVARCAVAKWGDVFGLTCVMDARQGTISHAAMIVQGPSTQGRNSRGSVDPSSTAVVPSDLYALRMLEKVHMRYYQLKPYDRKVLLAIVLWAYSAIVDLVVCNGEMGNEDGQDEWDDVADKSPIAPKSLGTNKSSNSLMSDGQISTSTMHLGTHSYVQKKEYHAPQTFPDDTMQFQFQDISRTHGSKTQDLLSGVLSTKSKVSSHFRQWRYVPDHKVGAWDVTLLKSLLDENIHPISAGEASCRRDNEKRSKRVETERRLNQARQAGADLLVSIGEGGVYADGIGSQSTLRAMKSWSTDRQATLVEILKANKEEVRQARIAAEMMHEIHSKESESALHDATTGKDFLPSGSGPSSAKQPQSFLANVGRLANATKTSHLEATVKSALGATGLFSDPLTRPPSQSGGSADPSLSAEFHSATLSGILYQTLGSAGLSQPSTAAGDGKPHISSGKPALILGNCVTRLDPLPATKILGIPGKELARDLDEVKSSPGSGTVQGHSVAESISALRPLSSAAQNRNADSYGGIMQAAVPKPAPTLIKRAPKKK